MVPAQLAKTMELAALARLPQLCAVRHKVVMQVDALEHLTPGQSPLVKLIGRLVVVTQQQILAEPLSLAMRADVLVRSIRMESLPAKPITLLVAAIRRQIPVETLHYATPVDVLGLLIPTE